MVALRLCVALLLLAGCAAPSSTAPASHAHVQPMAQVPATTTLVREFNGTILCRCGSGGESLVYQGDPPAFCFQIPAGTTVIRGHLQWDQKEPMGLEFHDPQMRVRATSWGASPLQQTDGPIDLNVSMPEEGEWFTYAGPGIIGAAITWHLSLTWEVARANVAASEVAQTRAC